MKTKIKKDNKNKQKSKNITGKTKLGEILKINPNAAETLFESGMGCIGCHMAAYETLEDGCKSHGMDKKEIEDLIKKLNK